MAGYRQKWIARPKTVDDWMLDVGWDVWGGRKNDARETLLWLMEVLIKDPQGDNDGRKEKRVRKEDKSKSQA